MKALPVLFIAALLLLLAAAGPLRVSPGQIMPHNVRKPQEPPRGLVIPPDGGERLVYCTRPLTLWLKVDSVIAPTTQLVAGTGEIHGDEGIGRHRGRDEVIYIQGGWGYAVFGADTTYLGPGSVIYVPPGTPHRLVSSGNAPLKYFWILAPMSSAAAFRHAAASGCAGVPAAPSPPRAEDSRTMERPPLILPPSAGERITYCRFPLTITSKVDSENAAETRLVAAAGALREGSEVGTHPVDEVVLITHGRGRGFVGKDTVPVEPGSVVYTPRGIRHGFINDSPGTLEYFIVYGPWDSPRSRAGFRALASQPGPWCPDTKS